MSSTVTITETVRKATADDAARLAETIAAAFYADPVMSWCYPDDDARAALLTPSFRALLDYTLPHGGVDTVHDEAGAAIWVPPEAELDEESLAGELGEISGEYTERVFTLLELLGAHHPQEEPHQYLFVLGTRPERQSQGIGSTLLRAVLSTCDETGTPAYLEATSERNRDLYRRHGFAVTEVLALPDGPPLWCMWRTPKDAS